MVGSFACFISCIIVFKLLKILLNRGIETGIESGIGMDVRMSSLVFRVSNYHFVVTSIFVGLKCQEKTIHLKVIFIVAVKPRKRLPS